MENAVDLNIVLLPDEKTKRQVIEWSKSIAEQFDTYFVLDGQTLLPHITLYQARYPIKNQPKIEEKIKIVAESSTPFTVSMTGFSGHWVFLFADVEVSNELRGLHDRIVDELNPLREGEIASTVKGLTGLTKEQEEAVEKFGYIYAKDTFTVPHITITRLKNPDQIEQAIKSITQPLFSFEASTVAIAPTAEHGTCPQPISVFNIK